jgi:hypothetical protein
MRTVLAALLLAALPAQARGIVTLQTRPGVTLSFFITGMEGVEPKAVALMLIGGGGNTHLREEGGKVKFGDKNFLPRARREFIAAGIQPVILDNPADQQGGDGMSDAFREGAAHTTDLRAVVADVKRRFPGLPVFLLTTSRSTISGAYQGRALGKELAGVMLSSSLFRSRQGPVLAIFDFHSIHVPILFVHHRQDTCGATPYYEAERLGKSFPLISVSGGKPRESDACEPFSPHGYYGKEAETVAAITAWMFGKPFPKEIP